MKKKQFALIFLTLIIMLTVWYIKSPLQANVDKENENPDNIEVSTADSEFIALREAVTATRATETAAWDVVIADENATLANKQTAENNKNALSDLTEKEVLLEVEVCNLGYIDAFVHYTDDGVEVYVLSTEESGQRAVDIINKVYEEFTEVGNVVVKFKLADVNNS